MGYLIKKCEHGLSIMDVHNVFLTKPYISCLISPEAVKNLVSMNFRLS